MRPVHHGDASSAARALLAVAPAARPALIRTLFTEAEAADRHLRETGRIHPQFGNGTLMAVARKRTLAVEPDFGDPDYSRCFEMVLRCLRRWSVTHSVHK
ncbi:MAG: hypothetical protein KDK24_19310 [Pseudooceanicola sp.]|nr:hypothetical protein [Pseudooceanicola sp.]MCB1356146.1 hypothetical protein [Maritimibacter sp.]